MPQLKTVQWIRKTAKYSNGIVGYIGPIMIGSVDWHAIRKDSKHYIATSFKGSQMEYDTQEEGMEFVINQLQLFINNAVVKE